MTIGQPPIPVHIKSSDELSTNLNLYKNKNYNCLTIMDYAHDRIHYGIAYSIISCTNLTGNSSYDLLFHCPNNYFVHIEYEVISEAELITYFYENTTVSDGGTVVTGHNKNRNKPDLPNVTVYHTPSINTLGDQLYRYHLGGGNKAGGNSKNFYEVVLKTGTNYLMRFTNQTSNDNWVSWNIVWFETQSV